MAQGTGVLPDGGPGRLPFAERRRAGTAGGPAVRARTLPATGATALLPLLGLLLVAGARALRG